MHNDDIKRQRGELATNTFKDRLTTLGQHEVYKPRLYAIIV